MTTEMKEVLFKKRCKFNNYGYCQYKTNCKYIHSETVCPKRHCKTFRCVNRHPKECRYKERCRRKSNCSYRHDLNLQLVIDNLNNIIEENKKSKEIEIEIWK